MPVSHEHDTPEPSPQRPKLLDQVRGAIRARHYSPRTEEAYVGWIEQFIRHHDLRHPGGMGEQEVSDFLTSLAVRRGVSASTQNQALSALLFLYREVLKLDIGWMKNIVRSRRPRRLPVVLTRSETRQLLNELHGTQRVMAMLLCRPASARMLPVACQGSRLCRRPDHGQMWKRAEGPRHVVAHDRQVDPRVSPRSRSSAAPSRLVKKRRLGRAARRSGPKIPQCRTGVGMAMGVPRNSHLHRS